MVDHPAGAHEGVFWSVDRLSEPWATLARPDPIYYRRTPPEPGLVAVQETTLAGSPAAAGAAAALTAAAGAILVERGRRLIS